ncbi:BTAD domain-containing putative transcriptional regulator [Actinoplanes philippinensis]|uniref:BTAD domain-containing putative transcriptional regulator n=1 Tax=Actinoplanes philippinensis TaxID=35752 RepID=UPI0015A52D6B|nr:BTAD domain-containing putative transcriptional regulator [Actinoplanes philippinensis]
MLTCRVLGPVEIQVDGTSVPLPGLLPRRLVTALAAAHGRPVGEDTLIDLLWGAEPPANPRSSLFSYVSRLRKGLGADRESLARAGDGYLLRVGDLDADRFAELVEHGRRLLAEGHADQAAQALAGALGMWRGEAFAELPEHAASYRARLGELRAVAVEERLAARLAAGDAAGTVGDLEKAVRAEPYRERRWELLILAQYRSGRQADALSSLRRVRDLLAEELGLDPGPALQDLERRLLLQDPRLLREARPAGTPRPLSAFLGRDTELALLGRLTSVHRLVTLVGPGGAGKTRLGVEFAADRAWFVRLADSADPLPAVAAALGLRGSTLERVTAALADRPGMLLLDNCEHLAGPVGELVLHLLAHCPGLRVLATSREPLAVTGEQLLPVDPLPVTAAVELLVDRISAQRPGWRPDAADAAHLAHIAAALDGIPLALELAAARSRMVSLGDLSDMLGDRFPSLGTVPGGAITPHQTLEAAVAWSVDLLPPAGRALLLRLWPFEGGFPLDAADDDLDRLSALVARSVVAADIDVTPTRYRLLEIIRAYCRAHDPDPAASRRGHADWVHALVARWVPELSGEHSSHAMRVLRRDLANVHAGIEHDLTAAPEAALRTASLMAWFWFRAGHTATGLRLLGAALAAAPHAPAADRGRALAAGATVRFISGDLEGARRWLDEARKVLDPPADQAERVVYAQMLYYESVVAHGLEDYPAAERRARESVAAARAYGEDWIVPSAEVCLGFALTGLGRLDEARAVLTGAIAEALGRRQGWAAALGEMGLGWVGLAGITPGRAGSPVAPDDALAAIRRSLRLFRVEDDLGNLLTCLYMGAQALALAGRRETAAVLLTAVRGYAVRRGIDPGLVSPQLSAAVDLDVDVRLDEQQMIDLLDPAV